MTTENATGGLMPSPFRFSRFAQSGIEIVSCFRRSLGLPMICA